MLFCDPLFRLKSNFEKQTTPNPNGRGRKKVKIIQEYNILKSLNNNANKNPYHYGFEPQATSQNKL